MGINKELLKGSAVSLILNILSRQELYGYELIKEIERRSKGAVAIKDGTLYPILHTLEKNGQVDSYWVEKENERPKKYYKITRSGRALLMERTKEWEEFKAAVDLILVSAKFSRL